MALILTFPMWLTVNLLGSPDNGVILTSYIGSFLMAGSFLAIGSAISALSKNQVIAFIVSAVICFLFVMSGVEMVQNTAKLVLPEFLVQAVSQLSFLTHFDKVARGVLDLPSVFFYLSMIVFFLFANVVIIEQKKAA